MSQVGSFTAEAKQTIAGMSAKDIPIEERRIWYNALSRRMNNPVGLKPGLPGLQESDLALICLLQ